MSRRRTRSASSYALGACVGSVAHAKRVGVVLRVIPTPSSTMYEVWWYRGAAEKGERGLHYANELTSRKRRRGDVKRAGAGAREWFASAAGWTWSSDVRAERLVALDAFEEGKAR